MWRTLALAARHTNGVLVTAKKFHDANPKICGAVVAAFEQANAFIKAHPREAAQIYLTATRDKNALYALEKMVADPDVDYTTTPVSVMKIVASCTVSDASRRSRHRGRTCSSPRPTA